jgi:hypothetical protein
MQTEELITKITKIIPRANGSEARIVAQVMFGSGLNQSVDVYVSRRDNAEQDWKLCSDKIHPNWRAMSVDDYIKNGRSEMLQTVSVCEIIKVTSLIGQPISCLN